MSEFETVGEGTVTLGRSTTIGAGAQVVFMHPGAVTISDYCSIGSGVKIVCSGGDVTIGDWTTLHDNCLLLCGTGVTIGDHCWFGQNCVIDGSGGLEIGSGVRVGMYSQIWSHVAAGEQIEGCTLVGERPVVIENDVWLVGSCIVASGVTLGERTVALIASNITKSWPAQSVLAGSPATLKPNLSFYKDISLDEKWGLLAQWLQMAAIEQKLLLERTGSAQIVLVGDSSGSDRIAFVKDKEQATALRRDYTGLTVCCVEDKSYNKCFAAVERRVLKYLAGNKARFHAC